jgi:hypothetical protein
MLTTWTQSSAKPDEPEMNEQKGAVLTRYNPDAKIPRMPGG